MGGRRRTRVFLDADVIHSKTLRDWIGLLYTHESLSEPPFDVHWSEDVLAEAEVVTPDVFFALVAETHPALVDRAIQGRIRYRASRAEEVDLCGALERAGCPDFAEVVLGRLQVLALAGG